MYRFTDYELLDSNLLHNESYINYQMFLPVTTYKINKGLRKDNNLIEYGFTEYA